MPNDDAVQSAMRKTTLIWLVLLLDTLIYAVLANILKRVGNLPANPVISLKMLNVAVYLFAIVVFFAAHFVRKAMMIPHPEAESKYLGAVIVSVAIVDLIGISGFILFLLGERIFTMYALLFFSALAKIIYRPKRDELEQMFHSGGE